MHCENMLGGSVWLCQNRCVVLLDGSLIDAGVVVRPLVRADGDALMRYLSADPEIARWTRIPWPYTRGHLRGFLDQVERWRSGATDLVCAITLPEDDELIGCCGVHRIGEASPARSSLLANEIGYWLGAAHRGRGVMQQAIGLLSRYALADLAIPELNLQTKVGNAKSQKVARALGYRFVRTVAASEVDDDDSDHDRFVMNRADYEAARGPLVAIAPERSAP